MLVRVSSTVPGSVVEALVRQVGRLPQGLMASLISESRAGMAFLRRLIPTSLLATDVGACFCDPQTPCQCGSNETISGPFGNIYGGAAWAFQACPATIPVQWL